MSVPVLSMNSPLGDTSQIKKEVAAFFPTNSILPRENSLLYFASLIIVNKVVASNKEGMSVDIARTSVEESNVHILLN